VLIGRMLAEEARLLLAGLALALAGGPMLLRAAQVNILEGEANLAKLTAQFIIAQFGDGAQFIVFAFSAYAASPALALLGGLLGVLAASGAALIVDQFAVKLAPLRAVRVAAGLALLLFGGILAINALGIG
jgi:putative Ca2+/H+ antiporter (TMEM165/GDT1 family)